MIYSQRIVVGDTETTGTDPRSGDRIIEIGLVEIVNGFRTGRHFHTYVNPERAVPADATAIHGITDEMLKDAPVFAAVAADVVEFIGDSPTIFHNAPFDLGFFDLEFGLLSLPSLDRSRVTDSLVEARKRLPAGSKANLDALCTRFGIDRSQRTKHGALVDSELLADVWLAMTGTGGLAHGFGPGAQASDTERGAARGVLRRHGPEVGASLVRLVPSDHEAEKHSAFVADQIAKPIWAARPAQAVASPHP